MDKKALVTKYRRVTSLACRIYNLPSLLLGKKKGTGNRIEAPCALLKKTGIRISGNNNRVIIGDFSVLKGASLYIHGDNNTITIGPWCHLAGTSLYIADSGGEITVGERTRFLGKTDLNVIEGTAIRIGKDCLFSSDIHFRTGDSHSVLDLDGRRINASEDIVLGDHVWVGTKVTCLKGAAVADHSIVGACSLVTKAFDTPNSALAGVPARIVRTGVDWSIKRIPVGEIAADFVPPAAQE